MTEQELLAKLYLVSGHHDFLVIYKKEFSEENWGEYYNKNKVIVLYILDEEGNEYDNETLVRVACHELAHHIQFHHILGYRPAKGKEHDSVFKEEFAKLLKMYYNGEVPQSTLDFVKEEGFAYDAGKKKRLPRRVGNVYEQTTAN